MKFIPTTVADVEKLKSRAKVLKRNLHIPHREALERAAREKGYLHWHHVTQCQKESDAAARSCSMQFLCESIQKDALRGETHYIGESWPIRFVVFANGAKDAALLDMSTRDALVLAVAGVPREFKVGDQDPPLIDWSGSFELQGTDIVIEEDLGGKVTMAIDTDQFNVAVQRASGADDDDMFERNLDDQSSAALLDTMLSGRGLEPITSEIADRLVASGYSKRDVEDAVSAGARYSAARNSIFYPPESM